MSYRLGVFGGMFDPVHKGHLAAARYALSRLELDQIQLIPCHIPNHRVAANASAEHRLSMLELALEGEAGMLVNPLEIKHQQVSYSINTLTELRQTPGLDSLVFVLGLDAFNSLPHWHRWQELFSLCHFCVLARAGSKVSKSTSTATELTRRLVTHSGQLFTASAGNIWMADDFQFDLSSTLVRERLRQGKDVAELLEPRVGEFIEQHGLYRPTGTGETQ